MDNHYDFVVYGASITGVCCSRFLSEAGFRVLLVNEYGFAGGAITETLSLYQTFETEKLSHCAASIVQKIKSEPNALLAEDDNGILINPELLKYILQEEIVSHSVETLFHCKILDYTYKMDALKITLSGREGQTEIMCNKLIDATDEGEIMIAITDKSKPRSVYYNMLADSSLSMLQFPEMIEEKKTTMKNISWFSFELDAEHNLSLEQQVHELIIRITESIELKNKKIQLLAPRIFRKHSFFEKEIVIDGLISYPYNTAHDQLITRASNYEQKLVDIL